MTGDGALSREIRRKTAEIDDWPAWAKPFEALSDQSAPAKDGGTTQADPTRGGRTTGEPRK
jgi:hypothetical protein